MNRLIIILILIASGFKGHTQSSLNDFDSILIRNVTVIQLSGNAENAVVSILIRNKNLAIVTKDKISLSEADIAFDAKGGFILGKLEVGELAEFIILDQDPRANVHIILDTKSSAIFGVSEGEVILNKMYRIDGEEQEQIKRWRSYSPPVVALPLTYQNKRKWNVLRTKPFTAVFGGAIVMENTRWLDQDANNEQQVGSLNDFEGGTIRGFRAGVGGTFNFKAPWTYVFAFGTRAFERGFDQSTQAEYVLYDYRVDIPIKSATLSIGKTRETISISRLSSMIYLPSQQERSSAADGLLPSRNVGIVMNNAFMKQRMTWAAGVFNNWYENDLSISNNPTIYTGRISALPFLSEDESNLLHLGIAGRYSNAAAGVQYKAKTEIFNGPVSVDTELIDDASSSFHYGLEMAWRKGPFILIGEYIQSDVKSSASLNPSFKGYYITTSYSITGEMRKYNKRSGLFNRVEVANGVNSGGWGELEVYCRWSSLDLNDKNIAGGEMNTLSLGVMWYPISAIQVNVNYRYSTLDRDGVQGYNHGLVTRLVFNLE